MMYKLILVASAVNVASEENTAALVGNLCTLISFAPEAVPMLLEKLAHDYAPKAVSAQLHGKDLAIGNMSAQAMCEDYKKGHTVAESFQHQKDLLLHNGAATLVEKVAAVGLGADSQLAQLAGTLTAQYTAGGLTTPVQRAKAFVELIVKAEEDPNLTSVSFSSIMKSDDATRMRATLLRVEDLLKKAAEKKPPQEKIECGTPIYNDLKELTKNGLYDELLAKTATKDDEKSGGLAPMFKKLAVRTAVSKGISFFADCPENNARILLA